MKSLILIVLGTGICWEATDIAADETYRAIVAPIGLMFFSCWGIAYLLVRVTRRGGAGRGNGGASLGDLGDFGGGD